MPLPLINPYIPTSNLDDEWFRCVLQALSSEAAYLGVPLPEYSPLWVRNLFVPLLVHSEARLMIISAG